VHFLFVVQKQRVRELCDPEGVHSKVLRRLERLRTGRSLVTNMYYTFELVIFLIYQPHYT
jgi:hypothetical protein